jgi:hypothetical protein
MIGVSAGVIGLFGLGLELRAVQAQQSLQICAKQVSSVQSCIMQSDCEFESAA